MTDSPFKSLTVKVLKERLSDAGLSTAGLKAELVSRLDDHAAEPAETPMEAAEEAPAETTDAAETAPAEEEAKEEEATPMEAAEEATTGGYDEEAAAPMEEAPATAETTEAPAETPAETTAKRSEDEGKIFIGGLSWITTAETLRTHFSRYSALVDVLIGKDTVTGQSRGFGFVTFEDASVITKVLSDSHVIDEKTVECKIAVPRGSPTDAADPALAKKVFVGGLSIDTDEAAFKEYFTEFGEIEEAVIMKDGLTGKSRGFGFITWATEGPAAKAIEKRLHTLQGKEVEVKPATAPGHRNVVRGGKPDYSAKKIFVGGLAPETTQDVFEKFFGEFGGSTTAL